MMWRWTFIFLLMALITAILGFGGLAGAAQGIAKYFSLSLYWFSYSPSLVGCSGNKKRALFGALFLFE